LSQIARCGKLRFAWPRAKLAAADFITLLATLMSPVEDWMKGALVPFAVSQSRRFFERISGMMFPPETV
jgi:hypothetical protein